MKSEFINIPGKGLCIVISDFKLDEISPSQIPSVNILFTDVNSIATEIQNGRKISAIKEIRKQTGWGLRESKDYIDKYSIVYGSDGDNITHNENAAVKFINDHTMEDFLDKNEMQL